jgi:hypothetical protein
MGTMTYLAVPMAVPMANRCTSNAKAYPKAVPEADSKAKELPRSPALPSPQSPPLGRNIARASKDKP